MLYFIKFHELKFYIVAHTYIYRSHPLIVEDVAAFISVKESGESRCFVRLLLPTAVVGTAFESEILSLIHI